MSDYNNNATNNRGNRRRRGGRNNRDQRGPSSYSAPKPPKQTGFQKFLSVITFGALGKPKPRLSGKSEYTAEPMRTPREPGPIARADREERSNRGDRPDRGDRDGRREKRPARAPVSTEVTNERLYIGNLSYDASESDLFELFNGAGRVKNAEVVVNSRTQRSKGFAFVTMMSVDEAKKAVTELNGKEFMGRPLVVGGAKPMPEGGRREDRDDHREPRQEREPAVHDDDVIRPPEDTEEHEDAHA